MKNLSKPHTSLVEPGNWPKGALQVTQTRGGMRIIVWQDVESCLRRLRDNPLPPAPPGACSFYELHPS
jgi:hypothetical protein